MVLADLCPGAPAARLLGVREPGGPARWVEGGQLVVAVPGQDVVAGRPVARPCLRRRRGMPGLRRREALAAAWVGGSLFTLAQLDPALGAEHLATWASGAVGVVTAGRSSWAKIHAVGEMARLSGTPLVSAVLVGADKTDESLGAAPPAEPAQAPPLPAPASSGA